MTISAIVTAHKDKEQLLRCLDGLKAQTKLPDEIIVCMSEIDGDISCDILLKDVDRQDWGHTKRDVGIKLANMDYIWFVNADDEYDPTYLEKLSQHEEDLIFCNFTDNGRTFDCYPGIGSMTSGNFIVRRKLAQKVGWNYRDYIADGRFIMELMEHGATYKHVPEALHFHR